MVDAGIPRRNASCAGSGTWGGSGRRPPSARHGPVSWNATPIVPRPAWAPITGPIWPTTISLGGERSQLVDERVDVAAVGVEHGEVLDAPLRTTPTLSTRKARALVRVRCLPCCSTTPSATSMIGLIDSAVASSALALPMRPPFLQVVERVERAEHARAVDELAGVPLDGVEVVAGGGPLGAGQGDRAEPERDGAAVDDADVEPVGGDGAGGQLGALHRRRQRAGERDDDDARRRRVGEAAVGLLEAAR